MKKNVDAVIAKHLKKGQKAITSYKIEPKIIGGMLVSIGDKYADMSIATKLNKYSEIIKSSA